MVELLHIPYSPWSEKARWALELCGVQHARRVYQPIVGELALRRMLRRLRGPVTVPVLRDGESLYADSFAIARYADAHGTRKLFPPGEEARVGRYDALSERGLAAGRVLALRRALASRDALLEAVPKPLRHAPELGVAIGRAALQRTLRKYRASQRTSQQHEQVLVEVLDTLRADLAASPSQSEPRTLLERFSYADIAMAQVLAFVRPPSTGLKVGAALRKAWEDPVLVERYADLVAWRDALYTRYRKLA